MSRQLRMHIGAIDYVAKAWGDEHNQPVLALHGWLDNCASFDLLAPAIKNCYVVCVDSAGHGQSSHRQWLQSYSLWQDVGEIFRIADELGWPQFHLLGHSRGAMMAFIAAGTFPERILSVNLIEGVYPKITQAHQAPARLRQSITELNAMSKRPRRYYSSFDAATQARVNGVFPISEKDAHLLASHGVVQDERGFYWCYDPKLLAMSEVGFSLTQVQAFYDLIQAPMCVYLADQGFIVNDEQTLAWLQSHPNIKCVHFSGDHHLHMHSQARAIAAEFNQFIKLS